MAGLIRCGRDYAAFERPSRVCCTSERTDDGNEHLGCEFPGVGANDIPARINGYECRPCRHCITSPDAKLAIVHYGVLDSQTNRRMANSLCDSLSVVLAAVDANDDQRVCKFLFELPQLRKNVNAVDSTVCPEIEQYDFPPQVDEPQRLVACVNPVQIRREVRCSNRGSFLKVSWHALLLY